MKPNYQRTLGVAVITLLLAALLGAAGLVTASGGRELSITTTPSPAPPRATATDRWDGLQAMTPIPNTTPLPRPVASDLDGLYVKLDSSWPQFWHCRRCADYRPAGGLWKLEFDKSVMRIYYEVTQWRSLASATVEGDRLVIFNDPYCPFDVGEYKWAMEDGSLSLSLVSDPCAFDLRAQTLTEQAWQACPAAGEAGPAGCGTAAEPPQGFASNLPFEVEVTAFDVRKAADRPEVLVNVTSAHRAPPEGIQIRYDLETIPYGIHRVLWANGDWIQTTAGAPYTAMGVQFLGDYMGWARVTFDGQEVWRGDTRSLGYEVGRYGGYMEVSGFTPGRHTLRVERLGVNSLPVTVMLFGFDE